MNRINSGNKKEKKKNYSFIFYVNVNDLKQYTYRLK